MTRQSLVRNWWTAAMTAAVIIMTPRSGLLKVRMGISFAMPGEATVSYSMQGMSVPMTLACLGHGAVPCGLCPIALLLRSEIRDIHDQTISVSYNLTLKSRSWHQSKLWQSQRAGHCSRPTTKRKENIWMLMNNLSQVNHPHISPSAAYRLSRSSMVGHVHSISDLLVT